MEPTHTETAACLPHPTRVRSLMPGEVKPCILSRRMVGTFDGVDPMLGHVETLNHIELQAFVINDLTLHLVEGINRKIDEAFGVPCRHMIGELPPFNMVLSGEQMERFKRGLTDAKSCQHQAARERLTKAKRDRRRLRDGVW